MGDDESMGRREGAASSQSVTLPIHLSDLQDPHSHSVSEPHRSADDRASLDIPPRSSFNTSCCGRAFTVFTLLLFKKVETLVAFSFQSQTTILLVPGTPKLG